MEVSVKERLLVGGVLNPAVLSLYLSLSLCVPPDDEMIIQF